MANKKDIELVIRARDEYSRALNKAKSSVERFARAQKATLSRRDFLGNARAEAQAAGAAYRQAGADAAKYGQALTRATANGERLTGTNRKLARAFIEARDAARASRTAMEGQTTSLAAATGGFAAFSRRVDRTTISLKNQAAAARAAGVANRGALGGGGGRGRGGAGANGREADEIKRLSPAKGRGILGLRPYELQNLSYQINDIVTGLVSGQKPMQIFAQQGGQIVQLFQRQALAFARSPLAPVILAATAALAPFVAAVTRLREEQSNLELFNAQIERTGTSALYTAESLVPFAEELDRMGGSMDDARASINAFIANGIAEDRFRQFGIAAQGLAKDLGIDIPEAAEKLASAFAGGLDEVFELNKEFNFLTPSLARNAIAMKESGAETGALNLILAELQAKGQELADKAGGPWSQAFRDLGGAWNAFVDALKNSDAIQGTIALVDSLSTAVANLISGLGRLLTKAVNTAQTISNLPGFGLVAGAFGAVNPANQARRIGGLFGVGGGGAAAPDAVAPGDDPTGGISSPTDARRVAEIVAADEARQEAAEERAEAEIDAARKMEEAERNATEAIAEGNEELQFRIDQTQRSAREQAIADELRSQASTAGRDLSQQEAAAAAELAGNLFDAAEAEKARNKAASGGGGASKKKAENVELERQKELEKGVNDLLALRQQLQSSITSAKENGDTEKAKQLKDRLAEVNTELMSATDAMVAFWQATGGPEAEAAILKLQQTRAEVTGTGDEAKKAAKDMNDSITSGAVSGIDRFARKLVETGDLFGAARDSFLQFASDFLREIAQMILKKAIFNALSGLGGAGGGGAGGFITGLLGKLFHSGGVVGSGGGMSRRVPALAFAGAPRFHSGGLPGLASNEVTAILKKKEEVLTEDDPRNVLNGGGGSGNTRVVNAIDGASFLEEAMRSRSGEKVILNFIRANPSAVRGALGV